MFESRPEQTHYKRLVKRISLRTFGYNRDGSVLGHRAKEIRDGEKRIQSDGKTTYRARIRLLGMPDISASFPTRTQAREWARIKENELKSFRYFPRDDGKTRTFAGFVDLYSKLV
ncbi:MAG: hypothetical protein JJU12_08645 [Chlamydiales bacterium]|nr:hypothetical protein [Chlamydiales bacterium]